MVVATLTVMGGSGNMDDENADIESKSIAEMCPSDYAELNKGSLEGRATVSI